MANETEIKLRIEDLAAFRRALKRLKARPVYPKTPRVREWNVIFDTPDSALYKRGQLLRIRTETPQSGASRRTDRGKISRALITFKRPISSPSFARAETDNPPERHKVREEIELQISDHRALTAILEALDLRGWFQYEKFRTTFSLPGSMRWAKGLLIELDETPIGTFVEIEGMPKAIDRAAKELGFSEKDYIVASYLALYLGHCRKTRTLPTHMVFGTKI